jgi:hypothetical protein
MRASQRADDGQPAIGVVSHEGQRKFALDARERQTPVDGFDSQALDIVDSDS